jgi:hypothetical protein
LGNVFVERLWRSLKCESIYGFAFADVAGLLDGIASHFRYFNHERPHQGLGKWRPAEIYYGLDAPAAEPVWRHRKLGITIPFHSSSVDRHGARMLRGPGFRCVTLQRLYYRFTNLREML